MGTVGDGAEASDRTHITESKQLWVAQNDLREPQMKLEAKSSSLQHWLQLTYELELHNYNAKKTIAEQQLQAAEEGCEKLSNRAGNFMNAFTGGGSTDDVDSQILKAKAVLFNLTTDLQEITYRWKQIEMLCGFPILLNPGFARLESTLHPNLINGAMRNTNSDVAKTRDNDDERKSNSSSLKDDRLGDLCTSEIKLEIENIAEVVDVSKTSLTGPSSPTEKEQKQLKTDSSPRSPESDEIIIIPPTQKPQHSEIITCNDDEVIPFGDQATVSRLELNHGVSSNKSTIILPLLTSFSKSSPSFICKTSDVPNSSTVPPVSTVVCPREAHLPPKLSSFKTDNEDLRIVTVKDDSVERNETPPALSPCPQISHTNFTIPNGYTVGDIKCTDLRENRLINYDENLDDVSEYASEYEEHGKNPKRSLDEPISEKKKNVGKKKAKGDLDEPRSEYEKEIEERRAKNLEFLKSIALDEAKNDFIDAVNSTKKKRRKSVEKSEIPAIKRTSKRQKELIYYKIDMSRWMLEQRLLSTESTFRKALKSDKFYDDFVKDFNGIVEEDCIVQTPVLYNKDILKQPSQKTCLRINKIYSPSALSWYPSAENLVLAVGGSSGNFGLWNIKESNSEPHIFSIHSKKVSHLQFNPCNPFQLISSSLDGTLVCCDMQKQISSKVLKISDVGCSYFDRYSPSSYLLSLTNGQVVIADKRTEYGQESYLQTRYSCHNSAINTINVHPLAKNYFVTAGSDRKVCIWDLRNLTHSAIVQTTYADSVYSAFFSPVSGKFLLTTSKDKIMRIFDCENMTEGRLKLHKTKEYESFLCNAFVNDPCKNRLLWLPNSDDTFACSQRNPLTVLQIYDKDFNVHETIPDGTPGCKYLNMFHPFKAAFTSVSQAGYIKVFA